MQSIKTFKWAASMAAIRLLQEANSLHPLPVSAIKTVNGYRMFLSPKRGAIHRDLYLHGEREYCCTEYLKHNRIGKVCLDVGANIGYYAMLESMLVGKGGHVYAIEPVKTNFEVLKRNIQLNGLPNVECFQLAAGARNAESNIFISESANLCSMVNTENMIGKQPVSVVTVDSFLVGKSQPDLVRMDVEGYEYEIIQGMTKTLQRKPKLLVEIHPLLLKENLGKFLSMLDSNGYHAKFVAYENKITGSNMMRLLYHQAGYDLPAVYYNLNMQQLWALLIRNIGWCPNVLFEKVNS